MTPLRCPQCDETLVRAAREGGLMLRNRYVRITATDAPTIVIACPACGCEVTIGTSVRGRLVVRHAPSPRAAQPA